MSSETLKIVVIRGSTIRAECVFTDFDGTSLDPDGHIIKLLKPDGSQQGSDYTNPTGSGGTYYQTMEIPVDGAAGEWSVEWTATITGEGSSTERIRFRVVE